MSWHRAVDFMIDKALLEAAMTEKELSRFKQHQSRMTRVTNDILVAEARQHQISVNLMGLKAIKYPARGDRSGYDYQFIAKAIRETTDELSMKACDVDELKAYQTYLKELITNHYEYVADRLVADSQAVREPSK